MAPSVAAGAGRARVKQGVSFDQRVKVTKFVIPCDPEVVWVRASTSRRSSLGKIGFRPRLCRNATSFTLPPRQLGTTSSCGVMRGMGTWTRVRGPATTGPVS
eukprot:4872362-Alexandrium_andersonii.AAC.1